MFQKVQQLLQEPINQQNIRVEMNFPPDGTDVLASRIEIEQVVFNLFKNSIDALALSQTKSPLIRVRVEPLTDRFFEIHVQDNGPGVDGAIVDDIFKPYVTNKQTGLGMGLSISQTIIEGHGGSLTLVDPENSGGCFRFTLSRFPSE